MPHKTKILTVADLDEAVDWIRQGECVAFPTETVYGLGADALRESAVARIFAVKQRPCDNPLIVHCHCQAQLHDLVRNWPRDVQILMDAFWPGPLTLVLPKRRRVPTIVTAGLDTLAVRIPDHAVALAFLRAAAVPIAAPSANLSGRPSPTTAEHVWQDLVGRIPAIVDGGPTGWGVESTVVDCSRRPFRILRPGGVTVEQLRKLAPVILHEGVSGTTSDSPPAPGMKYAHYAPAAQVILVTGPQAQREIQRRIGELRACKRRVAVLTFTEFRECYPDAEILELGSLDNLRQAAANLYNMLRRADALGCEVILAEGLPAENLGLAIMNRLRKAAGANIVITRGGP